MLKTTSRPLSLPALHLIRLALPPPTATAQSTNHQDSIHQIQIGQSDLHAPLLPIVQPLFQPFLSHLIHFKRSISTLMH
ncbi:hypothetical protein NC651_008681 [Populus alba x Populus x berolinensis]|nr:hypothetical protein NC651_008681 [Populus alba x Populus x berolinensis]